MCCYVSVILKFFAFYFLAVLVGRKIDPLYIYLISALAFLIGFILRWFNVYPGRFEPLWIDFATFTISFSLLVFYASKVVIPLRYGLLFIFSIHIIYNILNLLMGK